MKVGGIELKVLPNPLSFTIDGIQRLSVDPETRAVSFRTGDASLLGLERVARRLIVVVPVIACAGVTADISYARTAAAFRFPGSSACRVDSFRPSAHLHVRFLRH
jgi:hypothetical protein